MLRARNSETKSVERSRNSATCSFVAVAILIGTSTVTYVVALVTTLEQIFFSHQMS